MNEERTQALLRIQELEFSAIDLNLFLDTHPGDHAALKKYNQVAAELAEATSAYEKQWGPLGNCGVAASEYPWRWVQGPWPWEIDYPAKG